MLGAAVFGAEQMIAPRLRRFEPDGGVIAGHHVVFDPKRRHKEAVDDVFAGERELDRSPDRDVQGVDLPLSVGMLKLPHPLPADDEDLEGILRRARQGEIDVRAPEEGDHREDQRDHDPGDLEGKVVGNRRRWRLVFRATAVLDREVDHQGEDQSAEKHADSDQIKIERVDPRGDARGLLGKKRQRGHQASSRAERAGRCLSRLSISASPPPNATTVAAPDIRRMFSTVIVYLPVRGSYS